MFTEPKKRGMEAGAIASDKHFFLVSLPTRAFSTLQICQHTHVHVRFQLLVDSPQNPKKAPKNSFFFTMSVKTIRKCVCGEAPGHNLGRHQKTCKIFKFYAASDGTTVQELLLQLAAQKAINAALQEENAALKEENARLAGQGVTNNITINNINLTSFADMDNHLPSQQQVRQLFQRHSPQAIALKHFGRERFANLRIPNIRDRRI